VLDAVPDRPGEPGLAVAVIRGGAVAARRCVGLTRLSGGVPIGPDTRFHVVSVSKTFLAAAVLVLEARGELRLDDDIRRHLPELPAELSRNGPVTVHHLLSMTSGLRDVLEILRLQGVWDAAPSRRTELLALAGRQRTVSASPGAQYMYANVNALLLEEIVSRASGMPAESFRRHALYGPLGLERTTARPHDGIALPDLAEPYVPDGVGGFSRAAELLGIAADPLTTTLDDLTRWVLALRSGTIDGVAVTARMAARTRLRDGTAVHYGLGLAVRRYRGLTVLCHTGSQPGYKAHVAYVPTADVGIVVLSNREDTQPAALAASILGEVIGDAFPAPHPGNATARGLSAAGLGAAERATAPGVYVDAESGEWVSLSVEDSTLRGETLGDPLVLYPDADGAFRDGEDYRATVPAELRLRVDGIGVAVKADLRLGGQRIALRKTAPPTPSLEALRGLLGRYEDGSGARAPVIRLEGGGLVADYGGPGRGFAMEPIAPDVFLARPAAPGIAYRHVFRFERDPTGAATAVTVTMERMKGLRLPRAGASYQPA
jgi:CubicO group peptidase (beta-lactamase class C family)